MTLDEARTELAGVRSAVHEHLVNTGLLAPEFGTAYDKLFDLRMRGDYLELAQIQEEEAREAIDKARPLAAKLKELAEAQAE